MVSSLLDELHISIAFYQSKFRWFIKKCCELQVSLAKPFMASPSANTKWIQKGRECSLAEMFCVKCKEKKTVPDDQTTMEKTAKGRNMMRATCPTCGTKMTKFTK
jgi:hypothetical protein